MITKTRIATKAQVMSVLTLICKKYGYAVGDPYGPQLRMDFDWFGHGPTPTIVWEGGPYEWAVDCSFTVDAGDRIFLEPATNWALSIYWVVTRPN